MKIGACVLYIIILLVYFTFDYGRYWGDIYLQLQALMISYLAYCAGKFLKNTYPEQLLFKSVMYIGLLDSAYTFACMIRGRDFAVYNTNIFSGVIGISIVVILVHIAVNKDKIR